MNHLALVVTAAALLATGAALVAGILRRRRPGRTAGRGRMKVGAPEPDAGVPTFTVVALGTRGAGKTMLLSAMYHELQTPSGRSFFLTAPYEQVVLLNQWFSAAADTEGDWPGGTAVAESRTFTFMMRTRTAGGRVVPVLGLDYLEYAGGLLTDMQDPGSTRQRQLLDGVAAAHALIGIIDGYWLRKWLIDGDPVGRVRVQQSLTAMIGLMLTATCPVSFVVTKWDLLRDLEVDENARLHQVRKRLMSNSGFRDLVGAHSRGRVLRLIPVSAVGPDFADVDESGTVTKLAAGRIEPSGVELPLSAVVPDVVEQVEREVDAARLAAALERLRGTRAGPGAAAAELGGLVAKQAGRLLGMLVPHAGFLGDAALSFFGPDPNAAVDRRIDLMNRIEDATDELTDYQQARRRVLRELQSRVDVLEGRLPTSRLTAEDD